MSAPKHRGIRLGAAATWRRDDRLARVEAVRARRQWRAGFDVGRAAAIDHLLHGDCIGRAALEAIVTELKLLRVLYPAVCESLAAAQLEIRMLQLQLDITSPGWDRT